MKKLLPLLALALAGGGLHAAPQKIAAHEPLRPVADCPRINEINEWYIVDGRHAVVRTGPKHFLVTMQGACPRLGLGPSGLLFRASNSNLAVGENRICGEPGETVRSRNQPPCALQSVRAIDKDEFVRLSRKAMRHGSGADQPTRP
ncbi:DUF6491 family protein [Fulvimonas soli]|jgi:hypothetical protein|uniref:Uncharacterized protein n=1 Tax=Fulvimonas soli TaxID=155197 RepID=A0A316IGI9_9GAMM|nr:DUF6491 family protein [Fulvimonas soli]PWK92677.1 hypothetical protein C7456_1019 [Fulvimonas soli]TNY25172.1 hypothetical protein BV497_15320 [Fulvimonas soli]